MELQECRYKTTFIVHLKLIKFGFQNGLIIFKSKSQSNFCLSHEASLLYLRGNENTIKQKDEHYNQNENETSFLCEKVLKLTEYL